MRFIDVLEGAVLETLGEDVVFFLIHVVMGVAEKIKGAMEATMKVEVGIDRRMIVEGLVIVDGGTLDVVDGEIDLLDDLGAAIAVADLRDVSASEAQV